MQFNYTTFECKMQYNSLNLLRYSRAEAFSTVFVSAHTASGIAPERLYREQGTDMLAVLRRASLPLLCGIFYCGDFSLGWRIAGDYVDCFRAEGSASYEKKGKGVRYKQKISPYIDIYSNGYIPIQGDKIGAFCFLCNCYGLCRFLIRPSLIILGEKLLADSAKGALEILGKILKFRAGSDADFGIALLLVVYPAACLAKIFFHIIISFLVFQVSL